MSTDDRPWDRSRPRRDRDDRHDDRHDDEFDDEDDYDDRRPRRRRGPAGGGGIATTGLVLGILSLCLGCLTGIPAIICSAMGMKYPAKKNVALAGLILGIVGTVISGPALIALLLPAVQKVRDAAAQAKNQNNLKQVGLGMLGYQDVNNGILPPADEDLSWRVHILPYIERADLHRRFNMNQPWDSAANRANAAVQVPQYASLHDPPETTETRWRVFTGPGTIYEPGKKPKRTIEITDGTSNTILVAESADTVPWPQPKELRYSPTAPLPALGHPNRRVFLVLMADGAVRPIRQDASEQAIRAAITANGGEPVPDLNW
jgi:hypothetical protein